MSHWRREDSWRCPARPRGTPRRRGRRRSDGLGRGVDRVVDRGRPLVEWLDRGLVYLAFLTLGLLAGRRLAKRYASPRSSQSSLRRRSAGLARRGDPRAVRGRRPHRWLREPVGYWNALAVLADAALAFGLWVARSPRAAGRIAGALLTYGATIAVVLTQSRAGIVGAVAVVGLWLLLSDDRLADGLRTTLFVSPGCWSPAGHSHDRRCRGRSVAPRSCRRRPLVRDPRACRRSDRDRPCASHAGRAPCRGARPARALDGPAGLRARRTRGGPRPRRRRRQSVSSASSQVSKGESRRARASHRPLREQPVGVVGEKPSTSQRIVRSEARAPAPSARWSSLPAPRPRGGPHSVPLQLLAERGSSVSGSVCSSRVRRRSGPVARSGSWSGTSGRRPLRSRVPRCLLGPRARRLRSRFLAVRPHARRARRAARCRRGTPHRGSESRGSSRSRRRPRRWWSPWRAALADRDPDRTLDAADAGRVADAVDAADRARLLDPRSRCRSWRSPFRPTRLRTSAPRLPGSEGHRPAARGPGRLVDSGCPTRSRPATSAPPTRRSTTRTRSTRRAGGGPRGVLDVARDAVDDGACGRG